MTLSIHPRAPSLLRKRDGRMASFDLGKIFCALRAAGQATGEFEPDVASMLANLVLARLVDRDDPGVEDVQALIERELMAAGYYATARACILYHEHHRRLHRDRNTLVEVVASINALLTCGQEGCAKCEAALPTRKAS